VNAVDGRALTTEEHDRHYDKASARRDAGRAPAAHAYQISPTGRREAKNSVLERWLYRHLYEKFLFQLLARPLRLIRTQHETW
jgi:hypothetical protein